jgi:hypothetical protein
MTFIEPAENFDAFALYLFTYPCVVAQTPIPSPSPEIGGREQNSA